jgi:hypothetical protein
MGMRPNYKDGGMGMTVQLVRTDGLYALRRESEGEGERETAREREDAAPPARERYLSMGDALIRVLAEQNDESLGERPRIESFRCRVSWLPENVIPTTRARRRDDEHPS